MKNINVRINKEYSMENIMSEDGETVEDTEKVYDDSSMDSVSMVLKLADQKKLKLDDMQCTTIKPLVLEI